MHFGVNNIAGFLMKIEVDSEIDFQLKTIEFLNGDDSSKNYSLNNLRCIIHLENKT